MKLNKRFISFACAIAMSFSMATGFSVSAVENDVASQAVTLAANDAETTVNKGIALNVLSDQCAPNKVVFDVTYVGLPSAFTQLSVYIPVDPELVAETDGVSIQLTNGFSAGSIANYDVANKRIVLTGASLAGMSDADNKIATVTINLKDNLADNLKLEVSQSILTDTSFNEYDLNGEGDYKLDKAEITVTPDDLVPSETETPATEAPATEVPSTEAPATETPATEAPATETPATEAPATETPATQPPKDERPTQIPATETPATEAPATEAPTKEPVPDVEKGIKMNLVPEQCASNKIVFDVTYVGLPSAFTQLSIYIPVDPELVAETDGVSIQLTNGFSAGSIANYDVANKRIVLTGASLAGMSDADNKIATVTINLKEDLADNLKLEVSQSILTDTSYNEYDLNGEGEYKLDPSALVVAPSDLVPVATEAPATEAPTAEPTPTAKPVVDTVALKDLVSYEKAVEAESEENAVVYVTTAVTVNGVTGVYGEDYVAKVGDRVLTEKEYTDMIWAYEGKASDAINSIIFEVYNYGTTISAKINSSLSDTAVDSGETTVEQTTPTTAPSTQYKFTKWTKTGSSSSITSDSITRGYSRTYVANFNNFDEDTQYIKYEITSGDRYIDLVELADTTKINVEASTVGTARIKATLYDEATDKVLAESTTLSISVKSATSSSGSSSSSGSGSTGGSSIGQIAGGNLGNVSITDPGVINGNVNFHDLDQAAWARDAIVYLAQRGIINGRSSTEFAPNDSITRAEFAQLVINMYGLNKITSANVNVTSNFADVQSGTWYYNAVNIAANLGIVNGYPDGNFYPNNLVSRQEMALMMYRVANKANAKLTAVNEQKVWSDPVADWAADAVTTLQMAGVINGTSDTTFEAEAGATRAQAAQMIYNLYQVIR